MLVQLETDNLDKTYERMKDNGIIFVEKIKNALCGKQTVFQDLSGNLFDLLEKK